jgi:hypothetical protein
MEDYRNIYKGRVRLECFLAKLANGKPVEYYAQHIKNLAILGPFDQNEKIDRILHWRCRKPCTNDTSYRPQLLPKFSCRL